MRVRPAGNIDWLVSKIGVSNWHLIACSSFEERCSAVAEWVGARGVRLSGATILRLTNPDSDLWRAALPLASRHFDTICSILNTTPTRIVDSGLLSPMTQFASLGSTIPDDKTAVILDITTMPKRFFLFLFKQLMLDDRVRDLVVTYGRAAGYPEIAICEDALPPAALPGFGRLNASTRDPRLVVGVGYVALSVEDLVEQGKRSKLDFVFPFPPGSPAFRRNWTLLARLLSDDISSNMELHRIHGMDAFEVCDRVRAWGAYNDLDLIPLGPKPHALGMAMAYLGLDGSAELIYAQPRAYKPNYSLGLARRDDGTPDIYAYCLKRQGAATF